MDYAWMSGHMVVDVQSLSADFLVASSHKMCGPTGVGFLYGKAELLEVMPPFLGGGEMIADVYLDHSTYADPPSRFEAGTPAIGEAIGLGAAIDYLSGIGMQKKIINIDNLCYLLVWPYLCKERFFAKPLNIDEMRYLVIDFGVQLIVER